MLMESFEVENFRSLKHLKLEKLARVNVLVGKNNSGKTSVLEGVFVFTCIETPTWIRNIESERNKHDSRRDLRYFFYGFDSESAIKLAADYKPVAPTTGPLIRMSATLNLVDRATLKEQEPSPELRVAGTRRAAFPSAVLVNLLTPNNADIISYEVVNRTSEKPAYLNPLSDTARKFILDHADHPPISRNLVAMVSTTLDTDYLSEELEKLKVAKKDAKLLDMLQLIDPRIKSVDLGGGGQIYLNLGERFRTLSPLSLMGEGIQRLLEIVTTIASNVGGIVLIDEIDNGLHYSALRVLWKGILQAAREYDVQVFATTHSAEALRHLTWVLNEEEYADYRPDVAAYTLIRAKDDTVKSFRYDSEQLEFAMEHDMEVRN